MKQELTLTRDPTTGNYNIHRLKPIVDSVGCYFGFAATFMDHNFHKMFSVRLRKGRKKRIKRILIELED